MGEEFKVEAAPAGMDLNDLLGLTDEELTAEETSASEGPLVEEVPIDEPHITISTKKLLDILRVSAMVSAAGENSFEGKHVAFCVLDDKVNLLLSDNKRNIERSVDIINGENRFKGFLAFDTAFLARLVKVCGNTFSVIEREAEDGTKKYTLKITGGEIHMDNIRIDPKKFIKDFDDNGSDTYQKADVCGAISRLFTFASTAIKTGKNIDFVENVIQAQPIQGLAKIQFNDKFPTFRLSLMDAKVLYNLMAVDDADTVTINGEGKVFTGANFRFKTESQQVSNCVFDTVAERMFTGEYATVDAKHLTQIADLSVGLAASLGNLQFNYNKGGKVACKLLTKRENSDIVIQGTTNEDLTPLENSILVPAKNLRGALTVFPQETTLMLRLNSDGLALESGNVRVSVLAKGAGK